MPKPRIGYKILIKKFSNDVFRFLDDKIFKKFSEAEKAKSKFKEMAPHYWYDIKKVYLED